MEHTLYKSFNQSAVLQTINQMPNMVFWTNLDHTFFAVNPTVLKLCGFLSQAKAEGRSYAHMPCKASECYQDFMAQDREATNKGTLETLGLYCYYGNDWKILYGTKSLIKDSEDQPIGVCGSFMEVKNIYISNFLSQLTQLESYFKFPKAQRQLCYQLTDTISCGNFPLTERQSECLFYLLRGFTVPMIAERLAVSKRTVESHIENIKLKAGCFTKPELLEKALYEGWTGMMPRNILKANCER
jgi:DNA-binding CsgD family transcriptional regulator